MKRLVKGLMPVLLMAGTPAMAQTSQWRISEVSGDVRIVEQGRARAATRGALLASGSTIATAAQGRAVLVRGGEFVVVSPGSQMRIPDQPQIRGVVQWLTDWGTALFRVERRENPHFGVGTPYLAAVVKGTTFTVTVGPAGASVQVTEGSVEVSTLDGGAAELIRPGMIASVAARDLYQLNIDGSASRAIRSPGAPAAGAVTVPASNANANAYAGPRRSDPVVPSAVAEDPVSLADLTGGLVEGVSGFEVALTDVADERRADRAADNPGRGGGRGDDNGHGNDDDRDDDSNPGGGPPDRPGGGERPDDPGNGGGRPDDPGNGGGRPDDRGRPDTPGRDDHPGGRPDRD